SAARSRMLPQHEPQLLQQGVGLLSMRKRAELVQGTFAVTTSPGKGTCIRVEIPMTWQEPEPGRSRAPDTPP
ncbi:MAG: hypothetical protein M1118_16045, partial [Chloroflexi bacterium]|nr:hypothetical protein [Chloroflexota bacterium]